MPASADQIAREEPPNRSPDEVLRQSADLELIGEYQDSGFKEPPYLVRRPDGQVVQLPRALYRIVENADGKRSNEKIAELVSRDTQRRLSAADVRYLADTHLRPMGVLLGRDGSLPKLRRNDPMLALNVRMALVPPRYVAAITTVLRFLFLPLVVGAVLTAVVALDTWIFAFHGVAQSVRQLLYQPLDFLLVFGLILLSAGFHECGHASACRYSGAKPGALGAGLYLVWPVFYSDVTDAYRLGRWGRLRTDLGGVYFNGVFILLTAVAYFVTHFELLVLIMVMQNLEILRQFMPFLRLDGYYVVADVTGVPDIFARIKPTLRALLPGQKPAAAVTALKPWTRVVVTAWVVITVVLLLYLYGVMLVATPRILATTWSSLGLTVFRLQEAWSHARPLDVGVDVLQIVLLVIPVTGMGVSVGRLAVRLAKVFWRRTAASWRRRIAGGFLGVAAALVTVLALLPYQGRYEPIGPNDRGTVQGTLGDLGAVLTAGWHAPPGGTGGSHQVRIVGGSVGGFTIPGLGVSVAQYQVPDFWVPTVTVPRLVVSAPAGLTSPRAPLPPLPTPSLPSQLPTALPSVLPTVPITPSPSLPVATPTPRASAIATPGASPP